MYAENWTAAEASEYLSLSWGCENCTMIEGEILMATLRLDVVVNVTKSMEFAFDINIVGTGV